MAAGMVGELVMGRFRVLERIGSGGMGTVYSAIDERLQRQVAVKEIVGAAANGLGIAIGLDPLVRPYLDNGRLVRLWPGGVRLSRSFHLVRRTRRTRDRRIDRFHDWLVSEASYATA